MMDHFGGKPRLGDVQETALIPLAVDTKKYDKFISHEGVAARTILFDAAVKKLLPLDLKLTLMEEHSFWEEMKKYSLIGKIGNIVARKLNNRLAIYRWQQEQGKGEGQ